MLFFLCRITLREAFKYLQMFSVQTKAGTNFSDILNIKGALTAPTESHFVIGKALISCRLDWSFASAVTSGLHLARDN